MAVDLESELDALLDLDEAEPRRRAATSLHGMGGKGIVLVGFGPLGREVLARLRSIGSPPLAAVDNDPSKHGRFDDDLEVVGLGVAKDRWPDALFVITTYNTAALWEQLRAAGCSRITSYAVAWCALGLGDFMAIEPARRLLADADAVRRGWRRLADEVSREQYVAQVRARLLLGFESAPAAVPDTVRRSEYFPSDVYTIREDEVLVDGGAFDGDTIRRFLALRGDAFAEIHAFEPDPASHVRLQSWLGTLPVRVASRVKTYALALSDTPGLLSFAADGSVRSTVSDAGDLTLPAARLDDVLAETNPTLIKLDLEGAEPRALAGMSATLRRTRPVLAVCVYHAQAHLWSLADVIAAQVEDYTFALRAHAEACWDTTLYAVPKERRP
jgi:FkbM family methyltransferase